jgi:hypothetical protein
MTRILFLDPHWGWLWCIPGLLPNGYWHSFTGRARNWPYTQAAQLCNQELQIFNFSPRISITIKAATIGWDGPLVHTEELKNAYDASVRKAVGKSDLKRDPVLGRLLQSIVNHYVRTMWMKFIYSYHSKEASFSRRGRKLLDLISDHQLIQNCAPWSQ